VCITHAHIYAYARVKIENEGGQGGGGVNEDVERELEDVKNTDGHFQHVKYSFILCGAENMSKETFISKDLWSVKKSFRQIYAGKCDLRKTG